MYASWRFEDFYALGACGALTLSAKEFSRHTNALDITWAPVRKEKIRNFLAGVSCNNLADITLAMPFDKTSPSLLLMGVWKNVETPREYFRRISLAGGFVTHSLPEDFIESITPSIREHELGVYEMSKVLAKRNSLSVDKAFCMFHYVNLLHQYFNKSEIKSQLLAAEKFGLKL